MNVVVYINRLYDHHAEWCGAFVVGLKAHGINARIMYNDIPADCDLAVMWSHGPSWRNVIADRQKKGKDYLVLDRGYMGDRFKSTSISLNGFHGLSKFDPGDVTDERARLFSEHFKNWKPGKEYVLIMGQMPGDASLMGVDIKSWLRSRVALLLAAGHEVVYRPHPRLTKFESYGVPYMVAPLDDCLKRAECVYTYSSTSGIDAMLAGKPVIAESPVSMVYDLAGHGVDDIKKLKKPEKRGEWFKKLAHLQWSVEEIQSGELWKFMMERANA